MINFLLYSSLGVHLCSGALKNPETKTLIRRNTKESYNKQAAGFQKQFELDFTSLPSSAV